MDSAGIPPPPSAYCGTIGDVVSKEEPGSNLASEGDCLGFDPLVIDVVDVVVDRKVRGSMANVLPVESGAVSSGPGASCGTNVMSASVDAPMDKLSGPNAPSSALAVGHSLLTATTKGDEPKGEAGELLEFEIPQGVPL